jgi:hypothetical protein
MLMGVEEAVREQILQHPLVRDVRSAFMEFSEPSIATQLK